MKNTKTKKNHRKLDPRFQRVIDTLADAAHRREGFNEVVKSILYVVDWNELDGSQIRAVVASLFALDRNGNPIDDEQDYRGDREKLRDALADRALQEHSLNCSCCAAKLATKARRAA